MQRLTAILVALLAVACNACGSEHDLVVDRELAPAVNQYLGWAPASAKLDELVSVKLGDLGPGEFGECRVRTGAKVGGVQYQATTRTITIRRGLPFNVQRAATMHELAHCLHGKEHVADPLALMATTVSNDDEYWHDNLEAAVADLFSEDK